VIVNFGIVWQIKPTHMTPGGTKMYTYTYLHKSLFCFVRVTVVTFNISINTKIHLAYV